ncbi:hypothetical protein ACFVAJ_17560 [Agromyces sp. NPDC057679]|uniref:hypothetical protein n=1 Tax=Agromyces sp. NPDC057679 TaxID=3346207 RepID=UPI00367136FE
MATKRQKFADGSTVRFTKTALAIDTFAENRDLKILTRTSRHGLWRIRSEAADMTFTVTNAPDHTSDVILDNGDRWSSFWLEGVRQPATEIGAGTSIHYDPEANTKRIPLGEPGTFRVEYDQSVNTLCRPGRMVPVLVSQHPEHVDCGQCRRRKNFPA